MEDDPNAKASLAEEGCIAMLATRRMIDTIDAMVLGVPNWTFVWCAFDEESIGSTKLKQRTAKCLEERGDDSLN